MDTKLNYDPKMSLFTIFDGHGPRGEVISQYLSKNFQDKFLEHADLKAMMDGTDAFDYTYDTNVIKLFTEVYKIINNELYETFDEAIESGSTGVTILTYNKKLFCANVGDSEAGLVYFDKAKNCYDIKMLCKTHMPNNPNERARIESMGGRVEPYKDEKGNYLGPHRIWRKNEQTPGLMMSRTFGDKIGHDIGMSDLPDVKVESIGHNEVAIV